MTEPHQTCDSESGLAFLEFWKGYCESLCATASDDSERGDPLFKWTGRFSESYDGEQIVNDHLSQAEIQSLRNECLDFFISARHMIEGDEEEAGNDFHLTRNGHGCGFWDGDWEDYGNELTALSKPYGTAEMFGHRNEDGSVSDVCITN